MASIFRVSVRSSWILVASSSILKRTSLWPAIVLAAGSTLTVRMVVEEVVVGAVGTIGGVEDVVAGWGCGGWGGGVLGVRGGVGGGGGGCWGGWWSGPGGWSGVERGG